MRKDPISLIALITFLLVRGTRTLNITDVKTPSGWVRGYEENYESGQVYRFIKIPYAEPPIGELRFQKTRPIREWIDMKGIRDINGPQCPQVISPTPGFDTLQNDEDCLYLNVYVPGKISKDNQLSVMVWIHGGGFVFGGASQYKPQKIVLGGNVIVVTINYRLGLFGFLNLHDPLAPGNYGLWDQVEALRWIQKNIAAFGGNPKSITIFGQSAGGMSVSLLALIHSNEGLFQRAISQSGAVSFFAIAGKKAEGKTNEVLLKNTNCKRERVSETLSCLQNLPAENITEAVTLTEFVNPDNITAEIGSMTPTVDGYLIKKDLAYPENWDDRIYQLFRSIDFMSGTTDGEGNVGFFNIPQNVLTKLNVSATEAVPKSVLCQVLAPMFVQTGAGNIPSLTQEICDYYTAEDVDEQSNKVFEFYGDSWFIAPSNIMLSIHANNKENTKTFQYLFTQPSPFPLLPRELLPSWLKGAGHGDELHLLFIISRDHIPEEKLKTIDLAAVDRLSMDFIQYWTNFAKFGDPNSNGLPEWPSYDNSEEQYVIIGANITKGRHLKSGATKILNKILNAGSKQLSHSQKLSPFIHITVLFLLLSFVFHL
eukprot:XP_011449674.1 PREDICTED: carboxylesterase 1C [Crassostrea gigas]